ncbi:hypothetical protein JW916_12170 [Candidatus Sumerlaeota bacterium]|nr:hypothetical protein [Candidatus Sumerlaeota bacterium]
MRVKTAGIALTCLLGVIVVGCSRISPQTKACPDVESLTVDFARGVRAAQTRYFYDGITRITVLGSGQASGTEYEDAFYCFTDRQGNEIFQRPVKGGLTINGEVAQKLIRGRRAPPYDDTHTYTFLIQAPGGKLDFGVNDGYTADNTGR